VAHHHRHDVDLRGNTYGADIRARGARFPKVRIDPTILGVGVGFRF
jgi:outer membrane protein W